MAVLAACSEAAAVGDNGERVVAVGPPIGRPALASSSSVSTCLVQHTHKREHAHSARAASKPERVLSAPHHAAAH
jgi:hypothetical protein